MGRRRLNSDRVLTNAERMRRFADKAASIDSQMDEAFKKIDWNRRRAAERSLPLWVETYCVPLLLQDKPPHLGKVVLEQIEHAMTAHENYCILMGRGSGKTSYVQCAALHAIATGVQKFVLIISQNQKAANQLLADIFRAVSEPDTLLANDYPELVLPIILLDGTIRRRQLYHGVSTDMQRNSGILVFPRMVDANGNEMPTSNSIISCRGITSGLRGCKWKTQRPSCAILDDLQTSETATNPAQVEKLMDAIRKDVVPLAGKERLSICMTATQIAPDDLVDKVKGDKAWKVTTFPAVIQFPKNMELWEEYLRQYDQEQVEGTGHDESLQFYKDNQRKMDDGAVVFNPQRFSVADGHISAIQKLMELRHQIGDDAFMAEYQQSPVSLTFSLPITPEIVASRKSTLRELEIPKENVQFVCAASDLNVSQYITTVVMVFMRNHTSVIIWRKFKKCHIPANIPPEDYTSRLYQLLSEHGRELKALGIPIQAWSIDANGIAWNAVTEFAKNSARICGIPACAFVGRASHLYRSYMRTRLKEDVNRTLLCGDEDEHKKAGSGKKYTFFDSDLYHEKVQQGFLQEIGNLGSISWFQGASHAKWAVQVCGEKLLLKKDRSDGTTEYHWKENGPAHDALDAIGQCLATHASMGFATGQTGITNTLAHRRRRMAKKIRIV